MRHPTGIDPLHTGTPALLPPGTRRLAVAFGAFAFTGGLVSFCGWVFDLRRLADWNDAGISMQPNTALAAACAGAGLLLLLFDHRRAAIALGVVVAAIGASVWLQDASGIDLGIDRLFLFGRSWGDTGVVSPGRMGPPASLSWMLLGLGILLAGRGARARAFVPPLAVVALGISLLSIVGHLYGADLLYALPQLTVIALQTGTCIFAVAAGLVLSVAERAPTRWLVARDASGTLLRRALWAVVLVPVLLGYLRLIGDTRGAYDLAFGTALRTLAEIILMTCLLFWTAAAIRRQSRFAAEQAGAARASEARLAGLLATINDGFMIFDRDWRITFVNAEALRRMEMPEEEVLGKVLWDVLPAETANGEAMQHLRRAMRERCRVEFETFHAPHGRWYFSRAYPMPDGGLAVFSRDIDERKQTERERVRLLQAERSARADVERASAIKDEFLATLSHELRTPLNAILGWVRVLEQRSSDPAMTAEAVSVIARNAKAQSDLIADLLDMNRIMSGRIRLEMEDLDLSAIVREAVEAIRPAADAKQLRVELTAQPIAPCARGDNGRMHQVLWNLLSNAVKFTPEGGHIGVTLRQDGAAARIEVRDTGSGIAPQLLPHVFDRFRQGDASTTREHGGLGLGLAIVKQLVELHGGRVRAESPGPGKGATFTVELPLRREESLAPTGPSAAAAEPSPALPVATEDVDLSGITVLAVDDQQDARDLMRIVLEARHARVFTAGSADEALGLLSAASPDIILCDIAMPGLDGYGFIRMVRQRNTGTPALAVSAFARAEDRVRALRAGYQGHIAKPVEPSELVSTVAVLARSAGRARSR